jgi:hypothetical protein
MHRAGHTVPRPPAPGAELYLRDWRRVTTTTMMMMMMMILPSPPTTLAGRLRAR